MLRVLLASFVICAASFTPGTAQSAPPAADFHNNISTKQPNPHSNSAAGASSNSGSTEDSAVENELLALANQSRKLAGASPLRMDESLREAARAHAERMVASGQLEHQLPGEAALLQRIALVSPLKMDREGENIAYATGAPEINTALMRSPPHRENLLDRGFNVAGFAALWSNGRLYVVQDFAHEVPSYSAQQRAKLVDRAIDEIRQQAGLSELTQLTPADLDEAACSLAKQNQLNAHLLAAAYRNRRIITYTQSRPEVLPAAALSMLRDPALSQFAVGTCYARNAAYPTGTYWVAILLY